MRIGNLLIQPIKPLPPVRQPISVRIRLAPDGISRKRIGQSPHLNKRPDTTRRRVNPSVRDPPPARRNRSQRIVDHNRIRSRIILLKVRPSITIRIFPCTRTPLIQPVKPFPHIRQTVAIPICRKSCRQQGPSHRFSPHFSNLAIGESRRRRFIMKIKRELRRHRICGKSTPCRECKNHHSYRMTLHSFGTVHSSISSIYTSPPRYTL